MRQVNWGNIVLLVVVVTFVVFPLAGAAEAILLLRDYVPDNLRFLIAGTWLLLLVPLFVVGYLVWKYLRQ